MSDPTHKGARRVPFFDYAAVFGRYEAAAVSAITSVLRRGAFILQEELARFETDLAAFLGAAHVVGVANGTDALLLSLRAVGIGPGDEVILPSHTYVASAAAVHFVGASPVLVDCGPDHLVDPAAVEAAMTVRTRAIMPVHVNGRTCDMQALGDLCRGRQDVVMVEDAAQAVGARFKGRAAGTFGSAGAFSFYPAKVLGCFGDGGAIVTDDDEVADKVRLLRDHGRDSSGTVVGWGLNSRLDNLQAAVLQAKLSVLHEDLERRRDIARRYHKELGGLRGLTLPPAPDEDPGRYDVFQNYEIEADDRDGLREHLGQRGVGTIVQWGGSPIHHLPLGVSADLPATDRLFRRCLLLPMNPALSDDDVDWVCETVREFCEA